MGSKKWNNETLKKFAEENSKCEYLGYEEYIKNNKNRYMLKLKCSCGNNFNVELSSFRDKRRPKITCNECTNKNVSKKMSEFNDNILKKYVEENSDYKFLKYEKIKNQNAFGYSLYIHLQDKDGYKYFIYKSSFDIYLNKHKKIFQIFYKENIYNEFNAKLLIKKNNNYIFLKLERQGERFYFHIQDKNNYCYRVKKDSINTFLNNDRIVKFYSINSIYNEFNAKLLVEENLDFIFLKLQYKKDYYLHFKDKNNYKYSILLGNFKNKSFDEVNSGNIYSVENIKQYLLINKIPYTLLSKKYVNSSKKLKWECDKRHIFYMAWSNFKFGEQRCPICSESKGEQSVRYYCENNKISFNPQYIFKDLLGDYSIPLRFDFAIFKNEDKKQLEYLIEYDGNFHYEPIKNNKDEPIELAEKRLKKQQRFDKKKDDYCKENNISLLRIPYWEFDNIEKILDKELKINND